MSEIIGRVARAMHQEANPDDDYDRFVANNSNPHLYARMARAAIDAMREPTAEMIERGCMDGTNLTASGPSERLGGRTAGERMADQWRGMIDQALSHCP